MAAALPRLYSIPAGIPFARALALGVLEQTARDPLTLADTLLLVPTRRAARALRDAFAEALSGAALLPRIVTLGDVDDEDELFDPSTDDILLSPAVTPLRRRLLLGTLVQRWGAAKGASLPLAQAVAHAGELARFLDEAVTQGVDLTKLKTLAPETHALHWQDVVAFLNIVAEEWPKLLQAEGAVEPARQRDLHLQRLAESLVSKPPKAPVIAAGSTGSIPATAALLKAIAHLPTGAVVLPGLDTALDKDAWDALDPGHAQYGLRQLLQIIGAERADVAPWPHLPESYAARERRVRFLAEALRPPPATDSWRDLVEGGGEIWREGLAGFALLETRDPREEALVIACALREALETDGRTAALVTPDRGLARRVAAELTRWDIEIDDSAGTKLSRTPPGAFLALLARAAAEDFAPVPLLALLKHPLAACGETRGAFRARARQLEMVALRGLRPAQGLRGIAARLAAKKKVPRGLEEWFAKLTRILEPFAQGVAEKDAGLSPCATAHGTCAEALAASDSETGAAVLWRGTAGEAAAHLVTELIRDGEAITVGDARNYAELFRDLAEMRAVRPVYNRHPRLSILGTQEARLLDFDLVVLGGLNEGSWPADAATDPWLSRPMREKLGLEPPERRTGLSAHDFAGLAAARTVLMTRALKENGAPTVASRWLLRIQQLAKGLGLEKSLTSRAQLVAWADALDRDLREARCPRPAPRPPFAARPRTLSVTEIETWLRDPYAIYAKHVLHLKPLRPLDEEPGPMQRGIAIHAALEEFLRTYPDALPENAFAELLRIGDEAFAEAGASPAVMALWRPRYRRAARWFLDYETERRKIIARSLVELNGTLTIPGREPFILKGRADRIDIFADGSADVLDYKTGRAPSDRQIDALIAPQLPLEGAMLLRGAFADAHVTSLRDLVHIRLTGGVPPGEDKTAKIDAQAVAELAFQRLTALIARYDDEDQAYLSRAIVERTAFAGDYDHLARVAEWSRSEGEE